MAVSAADRARANQQAAEADRFARIGTRVAARTFAVFRADALAALASGRSPLEKLQPAILSLQDTLESAMLVARLKGVLRVRRLTRRRIPRDLAASQGDTFDLAAASLQKLLGFSERELDSIQRQFHTDVVRVTAQLSGKIERQLRSEVNQIQLEGLHVAEGKKRLGEAFKAAGIVPENSFTLESIVRTQTMLAYGAGKANVESDPAIQEILWGYKYVTVGDDRVRPTHAAMDGVTLPKDDPFWDVNYPPCGWACRCQALPILEEVEITKPPAGFVGADPGFRFRPDQLFGPLPTAA